MGSLPEFLTKHLASSVVGTLGVDKSGQRLGESIAGTGAKIANVGFKQLAERKKTIDIVKSQAEVREFENELNELSKENRSNFIDDPQAGIKQFNEDSSNLFDDILGTLEDPSLRRLFAQGGTQVLRGQTNKAIAWGATQEIVNAAGDFNSVINLDAGQLKSTPSRELYEEKLAILEGKKDLIKKIWGKSSGNQMAASKESLSKGYLHGLMNENPLEGRQLLKEGFFNGRLDTTEQVKFEGQMESSIKGWKDKIDLEARTTTIEKYGGIEKLWLEGRLDTAAVNALSDEMDITMIEDGKGGVVSLTEKFPELKEINKDLLKIAAENTDIKSIESIAVVNKIADSVRRLNISPDKRTADGVLEDIMKVRGEIIEAVANRQMKSEKARGFLDQLTTPMIDKLSEAKGKANWLGFGNWKTPQDAMYDSVVNKLAQFPNMSEEVGERMKANVITQTLDELSRMKERFQPVTNEVAIAVAGRFIQAEWAKENPALQDIPKEGKLMRMKNGSVIKFLNGGVTVPFK